MATTALSGLVSPCAKFTLDVSGRPPSREHSDMSSLRWFDGREVHRHRSCRRRRPDVTAEIEHRGRTPRETARAAHASRGCRRRPGHRGTRHRCRPAPRRPQCPRAHERTSARAHERTMDACMAAPDIAATRCRRLALDDRNMTADGPRAHGDLTGCVTRSHFPRRHRSPSAVSAPTVRRHTTNRGRTTWATQADRYRYRCRYERDDGSNYDASVG